MERLLVLGLEDREEAKERKIELIEEFYKKYRRLPKSHEKYRRVAIGTFLDRIKQGRTRITEEQRQRLLVLGFVLEIEDKEEVKKRKIELVEEFYREYGRLPKSREKYRGASIGTFLDSIKQGNTRITEEQMARLMVLGFEGQINDVRVTKGIRNIEAFYKRHGRLTEADGTLEGNRVGEMLLSIRSGRIRITEQQFLRLQEMGVNLTREQVTFFERPRTYVKK